MNNDCPLIRLAQLADSILRKEHRIAELMGEIKAVLAGDVL